MLDEPDTATVEGQPLAPTSEPERTRSEPRRWWRRPVVATTFLIVVIAAWQIFGAWHAGSTISPELLTAIENEQPSNIVVTMSVDPERFHSEYFRERGSVALVEGRQFFMRAVAPDQIQRIGSEYWVVDVKVWEES